MIRVLNECSRIILYATTRRNSIGAPFNRMPKTQTSKATPLRQPKVVWDSLKNLQYYLSTLYITSLEAYLINLFLLVWRDIFYSDVLHNIFNISLKLYNFAGVSLLGLLRYLSFHTPLEMCNSCNGVSGSL